jgi:hypothetical protein
VRWFEVGFKVGLASWVGGEIYFSNLFFFRPGRSSPIGGLGAASVPVTHWLPELHPVCIVTPLWPGLATGGYVLFSLFPTRRELGLCLGWKWLWGGSHVLIRSSRQISASLILTGCLSFIEEGDGYWLGLSRGFGDRFVASVGV